MLGTALDMGSDSSLSLRRLALLLSCLVVVSGIAYGGVAAQSGQSVADNSITTAATQNYSITVSVTDSSGSTDTATVPITVSNSSDTASGLARFDTGGNNQIDRGEAVQAIIAYNTNSNFAGQPVDRGTAVQVVIAYNTGQSI